MARQIAAHVTMIYPEEIPGPASLGRRAAVAAASTPPFTLETGPAFHAGSPADGVFLRVHDLDGGLRSFRAAAVPSVDAIGFPAHVTIVHPRTSNLGEQAWAELATCSISVRFTITRVAITAFDGDRWQTLRILPLTGR